MYKTSVCVCELRAADVFPQRASTMTALWPVHLLGLSHDSAPCHSCIGVGGTGAETQGGLFPYQTNTKFINIVFFLNENLFYIHKTADRLDRKVAFPVQTPTKTVLYQR